MENEFVRNCSLDAHVSSAYTRRNEIPFSTNDTNYNSKRIIVNNIPYFREEWEFCRDNLFGEDKSRQRKALQHLYVWKTRYVQFSFQRRLNMFETVTKFLHSQMFQSTRIRRMHDNSYGSLSSRNSRKNRIF